MSTMNIWSRHIISHIYEIDASDLEHCLQQIIHVICEYNHLSILKIENYQQNVYCILKNGYIFFHSFSETIESGLSSHVSFDFHVRGVDAHGLLDHNILIQIYQFVVEALKGDVTKSSVQICDV